MEWLLQVENLIRRARAQRERRGLDVRKRRAHDDFNLFVEGTNVFRRPGAIVPGGHAHVQEDAGVGPAFF